MSTDLERSLMRLVHGEVTEAERARLEELLERDGDAAKRFGELQAVWAGLEAAPIVPPDATLLDGIRERIEGPRAGSPGLWGLSVALSRGVAVASLAGGIGLGVWLGAGVAAADDMAVEPFEPNLAESYWSALASEDDAVLWEGE